MKIAIVGHGRMGHEVEAVLRERGHQAVVAARGTFPKGCAAGIEFCAADAVIDNTRRALQAGARYVIGTTGWADREAAVRDLVTSTGGGLVHAANFSLGVNLFYQVVRHAAGLLAHFPEYDPYIVEKHHRKKKDAPSGTAKVLARHVAEASGGRLAAETALPSGEAIADGRFHVAAVRAGGIVGEHIVGFDSGGDEILLEHRARSRRGFALGAVLAAEWIATRTGFHSFDAVVADLVKG